MFSYVLSSGEFHSCRFDELNNIDDVVCPATSYFHLPIDDEEEEGDGLPFYPRHIAWEPVIDSSYEHHSSSSSASSSSTSSSTFKSRNSRSQRKVVTMKEVLAHDDLYEILGVAKASSLDKIALRRAYLSRSKACHPECVLSPKSWLICWPWLQ